MFSITLEGLITIYITNSFIMRLSNTVFLIPSSGTFLEARRHVTCSPWMCTLIATSIRYPAERWLQECPEMGLNIYKFLTD